MIRALNVELLPSVFCILSIARLVPFSSISLVQLPHAFNKFVFIHTQ
jgi:hypothetical protein